MADVFSTSKFEVKHDVTTGMYSVVVKLPEPNGPLVFGVTKDHLQELLSQINAALGESGSSETAVSGREAQRQEALNAESWPL